MTVENLEINKSQVQDTENGTESENLPAENTSDSPETGKGNEVVALSVKGESEKAPQRINLVHKPSQLPGNRPVEASHLKVVNTYSSVGGARPITAGEMEISSTLTVSGNRPIAVSHLKISETYSVMGNRPVASNEIDDPSTLMGYID
ncbi:MAG: hypothetical protein AB4426_22100 [Xenococcaceae cyanobacterium]